MKDEVYENSYVLLVCIMYTEIAIYEMAFKIRLTDQLHCSKQYWGTVRLYSITLYAVEGLLCEQNNNFDAAGEIAHFPNLKLSLMLIMFAFELYNSLVFSKFLWAINV